MSTFVSLHPPRLLSESLRISESRPSLQGRRAGTWPSLAWKRTARPCSRPWRRPGMRRSRTAQAWPGSCRAVSSASTPRSGRPPGTYKTVKARHKTVEIRYETVKTRYTTVEARFKTVKATYKTVKARGHACRRDRHHAREFHPRRRRGRGDSPLPSLGRTKCSESYQAGTIISSTITCAHASTWSEKVH